ncbi:MAG: MFS transporter [archaeon]|nr:MAG: MFS transporter [archaeon]
MSGGVSIPGLATLRSIPIKVRLLVLSQIVNTLAFGYFLIYVSGYLVDIKVLDGGSVGLIFGIEGLVLIAAGIPLGLLSDKKGRKWFLILGNVLLPPTVIIFAITHDFSLYLVAAVTAGVAEAASLSSWNAIIADQTEPGARDAAFSLSFIVGNVGISAGLALPLALPVLGNAFGVSLEVAHSQALLYIGIASFFVPVLLFLLLRGYREKPKQAETSENSGDLRLLLKFSGMSGIIGLGAGLIIPLMGTWFLYKFAVPDIFSGPFLALSGMTIAFAALGSAWLSKRFGLFRSIVMTAGSSTAFMASMAFIPNLFLAGGVYLVRASLMNMAAPLMDSYLMGIIHPGRRGLASAISAIVWRLPNSISTIVGGYILLLGFTSGNHLLYDAPWLGAAGLYVLGISLLYTNFRNVKTKG